MKQFLAAALGLMLPALPALAADPPADLPPVPQWSSAPGQCSWAWREGGGMGLWTEACQFGSVARAVAYDPADDRFVITSDGQPGATIVQQFRDPGGPAALVAKLKAQGLVLDNPECQMVTVAGTAAPAGWTGWNVMPTGKLKEAFDKEVQQQVPDPPCGPLGFRVDSVTFFMVKDGQPGRIFFVDLGQEAAMLDIKTFRLE